MYIDYIICKVNILLLLFRYIFVYSIRFVYFFWIEVFGIYMRIYIFFFGVINRIVIYKEKNDIVNVLIIIVD